MIARCEEDVKSFDKEIDCINLKIKKTISDFRNFETLYSQALYKVNESENNMKVLTEQEIVYKKLALDTENSVNFLQNFLEKVNIG